MADCSARGVAGSVETLVHIPLTAQPHKSWRAGAVEASRLGGAGSVVVTGLRLTSVLFFGAVLSFIAWGTLETQRQDTGWAELNGPLASGSMVAPLIPHSLL